MNRGQESRRSLQLASLPPSMPPPPSWKKVRKYRWTHTHCDSHTGLIMIHASEVPEAPYSSSSRMGNVLLSV